MPAHRCRTFLVRHPVGLTPVQLRDDRCHPRRSIRFNVCGIKIPVPGLFRAAAFDSLRRPLSLPIARMAASTAVPSHCRAIWASQIPQSPGSSYPRSACPYPARRRNSPGAPLPEPFWVFRLADRAEPQPNPKKQAEATRGSPKGLSTHAGAEFSTRQPIAWPCSTGLRLPERTEPLRS